MAPEQWRPVLRLGDLGEDVRAWQRVLIADGRDIGRAGADGDFGKRTHNATVAWQRARSLRADGVVGARTRGAVEVAPMPPTWRGLIFKSLPYVEAVNWSRDAPAQIKRWIVLHSMEAAEASTTAETVAEWFAGMRGPAPRASAHACIDDDSVVQCVPWDRVAWHAPGANRLGIGLEHAGYARQSAAQWSDDFSVRMLDRSSWLAAQLCDRFGIPAELVPAQDLHLERAGITTHDEVRKAFGRTTHTDPGASFPMEAYLASVRRHLGERCET